MKYKTPRLSVPSALTEPLHVAERKRQKNLEAMSLTRRRLIAGAGLAAGTLLSACDRLNQNKVVRSVLHSAEGLNKVAHRSISDRMTLAKEYPLSARSRTVRPNGTYMPQTDFYLQHMVSSFQQWTLEMRGLFARPMRIGLEEIYAMPARTQVTRHDCVEGWSAIGQWTGVPLKLLLDMAGLQSKTARYLVFHCGDTIRDRPYYESIDLIDAYHPQTIMAYRLNGEALPIANGAPLRLRVERQLGYKHAKYVYAIEAVESFAHIYEGNGGMWEDYADYAWYAGV